MSSQSDGRACHNTLIQIHACSRGLHELDRTMATLLPVYFFFQTNTAKVSIERWTDSVTHDKGGGGGGGLEEVVGELYGYAY